MLKINPICRELEEVVVQAQEALKNRQYDEADRLLTEATEGCKYLIAASQAGEEFAAKKSLVLKNRAIYIGAGIFILILILAYYIPYFINKFRNPELFKKKKVKVIKKKR